MRSDPSILKIRGAAGRCLTFGLFHQKQHQLVFVNVELTMLKVIQQSAELLIHLS